jgi:maleate isomerase
MWAMAPPGVSINTARVLWKHDARAFAEPPHVDLAAQQFAALKPRVIVYAFTGSSYVLGAAADAPLRARLEERAGGVPVVLPCVAAREALRAMGVRRVALVHPPWFSEETSAKGAEYFRGLGFDVVRCTRMEPARAFTEVAPAEVYDWAVANVPDRAEAVLIMGNGLRAVGAIRAIEGRLRRPVLTANQVAFWWALRAAAVTARVTRYGRLFTAGGVGR